MGGPDASILLREPLTPLEVEDLEALLNTLGKRYPDWGATHIQIFTTIPIGGSYQSRFGCPVDVYLEAISAEEQEEVNFQPVADSFGFIPRHRIGLSVGTNQPEDHLVLAHLALHLCEQFNGVINFQGALFPALPNHLFENRWFWEAEWADVVQYSRALTDHLLGRAIALLYETISERTWAFHVSDGEFLRAWIAHSDFHMIK